MATFQIFQFIIAYALVQAFNVNLLYTHALDLGNFQVRAAHVLTACSSRAVATWLQRAAHALHHARTMLMQHVPGTQQ
jgi:hypothetical protein